jgi:hypothetical protein
MRRAILAGSKAGEFVERSCEMRLVTEACLRCDFRERFVQLRELERGMVDPAAAEIFTHAASIGPPEHARDMHRMKADSPGNIIKGNRLRKPGFQVFASLPHLLLRLGIYGPSPFSANLPQDFENQALGYQRRSIAETKLVGQSPGQPRRLPAK